MDDLNQLTFGQKLKKLRKEQDCSQEELAAQLEVSRQAVSKWESDRGLPEVDKLRQISNRFGVTLDYLLKEESEEEQQSKGYYVSSEMLDGFFSYKKRRAKQLAAGAGLIMFSDFFYCIPLPERVGGILCQITMSLGFAVLIWYLFQPRQYIKICNGPLLLDKPVMESFRETYGRKRKHYVSMIIAGVFLLLAAPELLGSNFGNALTWTLSALCAVLFLFAGSSIHAQNIIAKNSSPSPGKNRPEGYGWLYAAIPVTAVAVVIGIVTNAWSPAMPIIVLFCILLSTLCKLILERRNSN